MTNLLRTWMHAHLDAPLDDVYARIDEVEADGASLQPLGTTVPDIAGLTASGRPPAAGRPTSGHIAH